jgi:hypothetical protein
MSSIEQRVSKLEKSRHATSSRFPGIPAEAMREIRRVAAVCETPVQLEGYLKTIEQPEDGGVTSIEVREQSNAARRALSRTIFEEARFSSGALDSAA